MQISDDLWSWWEGVTVVDDHEFVVLESIRGLWSWLRQRFMGPAEKSNIPQVKHKMTINVFRIHPQSSKNFSISNFSLKLVNESNDLSHGAGKIISLKQIYGTHLETRNGNRSGSGRILCPHSLPRFSSGFYSGRSIGDFLYPVPNPDPIT